MSKRIFSHKKVKEYWRRVYHSTKTRISRGASNIFKIISWPKGDKWRRPKK